MDVVQLGKVNSSGIPGDAPQWAVERAQRLVSTNENILAVYVVSDENRCNAIKQPFTLFACPLLWVHALLVSPCMCALAYSQNNILKSTIYVVTDKRIYKSIDGDVSVCCCCNQGKDSGDVNLEAVTGVGVDMPGMNCCCPVKYAMIALPIGHPMAIAGGGKHMPPTKFPMLVSDPDATVRLIREAKDALSIPSTQGSVVQASSVVVVEPMEMEREDPIAKIGKLKQLLDLGALTQEEVRCTVGGTRSP